MSYSSYQNSGVYATASSTAEASAELIKNNLKGLAILTAEGTDEEAVTASLTLLLDKVRLTITDAGSF